MEKPAQRHESDIQVPPRTIGKTLLRLGPGMIIAGSIVGSGELIATTKTGAEAGFWLLWLIILGCIIKVFAQVEFGRHTITWSQTPLKALNSVPGPRTRHANWILWYWAIMTLLVITQQGGIVGGVGQTLAISRPLTEYGAEYNALQDDMIKARVELAVAESRGEDVAVLATMARKEQDLSEKLKNATEPRDAYYWAVLIAIVTSVLLFIGRYGLIQVVATVLVTVFTIVTIFTLIMLQTKPDWAVSGAELARGFSFQLPPRDPTLGISPIATALGAFGIIGVGAAELIMYPYWCLEKGYAKYTGPRDKSPDWIERARGWIRVLQLDAWMSMVVYTFATVAFFLLGAAVLGRAGLNPAKGDMVRILAEMYVPVFGDWAPVVFLIGAFAVLYSTFFVAAAGNARMVADAIGLFGLVENTEAVRMKWTRILSALWPLVALIVYLFVKAPAAMVLASGIAQSIMLPMLGVAALYFRYKRTDENLKPGGVWTILLWVSFVGFLIAGGWSLISTIVNFLQG